MKPKLYKSLLYSMVGAGMLSLGSCTDLSETIYNQIASEKYEFTERMPPVCLRRYIPPCAISIGHGTGTLTWISVRTCG